MPSSRQLSKITLSFMHSQKQFIFAGISYATWIPCVISFLTMYLSLTLGNEIKCNI